MQSYTNRAGVKVLTRSSAMTALAAGGDPSSAFNHPNYHVRRAAFLASGQPIPDDVVEAIALFKSICPGLFQTLSFRKTCDAEGVKNSDKLRSEVDKYNEAAVLKNAAFAGTDRTPIALRVAEGFVPLAFDRYGETYASNNALAARFLVRPAFVEALPFSNN